MLDILSITLPIFIVIGLGYLAIEWGVFAKADTRVLGAFVLNFALPALIVRAFAQRSFTEVFNAHYVAAYALGSLAVLLLGVAVARWVLRSPLQRAAIGALGMAGSNSGFIGYPLLALVLGPTAGVAMALNMLVENILIIPLALALAESGSGQHATLAGVLRGTAARLARTPMIVAIAVGMALSLAQIALPTPVLRTIDMLAMASGPVALFVIGAVLHGLRLGGMGAELGWIVLGKLLLHPLAVLAALQFLPIASRDLHVAALLSAAVPMISIYPLMGQRFGQEKLCAAALLVATVLSFGTLSVALWLLR